MKEEVENAEVEVFEEPQVLETEILGETPDVEVVEAVAEEAGEIEALKKALKDTKSWATKLSQDNAMLKSAVEAAINVPLPSLLSSPDVGERFMRVQESLGDFEEFGPLLDLLDAVIRGVAGFERELLHQALIHSVIAEHPDALDLREDPEFIGWVHGQPPMVKNCLVHSLNPSDVNWALRQFKADNGGKKYAAARTAAETARKEKLRHTISPSPVAAPGPSANRFTREDIARMSLTEFRKNEAQIDAALSRGEIV